MENLRQWAFSVSTAMVLCGIIKMLLPGGDVSKTVNITLSVFFLCALLSPVFVNPVRIELDYPENNISAIEEKAEELVSVVEKQSNAAAVESTEKIIIDKLSKMGINHIDITININTKGQQQSDIISADITLPKEYEQYHEAVASDLKKSLGFTVRLGYA